MSWYSKPGDSNYNQFTQDVNPRSIYRFSVKKGERKRVLFLDNQAFTVQEATIKIGANRFDTYTSSMSPDCPLFRASAMKKIRLQKGVYYTVLDLTPYKDKQGKDRKYSKKAFVARGTSAEILLRRMEENGGTLVGKVVECFRDGEKSPACGNDFKVIQSVDLSKLPPDDVKPYDFVNLLKPPHPSVLEAVLKEVGQHEDQPDILAQAGLTDDPASVFGADPTPSAASVAAAPLQSPDDLPF